MGYRIGWVVAGIVATGAGAQPIREGWNGQRAHAERRVIVIPRVQPAGAEGLPNLAVERIMPMVIKSAPAARLYVCDSGDADPDEMVRVLQATGEYDVVERDSKVWVTGQPNDPYVGRQWHLSKTRANVSWAFTPLFQPPVLAFVDTGVDVLHSDIAPNLVPGYNSIMQLSQAQGGDVVDTNGHGTAVVGTAAAVGNNGRGVCGLGWNIPVMPVKVTSGSSGGAYISDVLDGVVWAVRNGAKVVNASFAGVQMGSVEAIGEYCRSNGAVLVWPSDNAGQDYGLLDRPNVIVVGGTDATDTVPAWSSYGRMIDLVAPATVIYTCTRGGFYGTDGGNSFAAPQVAGTLAVMWSMDRSLSVGQLESILLRTCMDVGTPGVDVRSGHGRLDVASAVRLASKADFNRDGFIDGFDYDDFVGAFEEGARAADISGDGFVDAFDYDLFIGLFEG